MYDLLPLNLLRRGQRAQIADVVGLPELVHRLHEQGVRQGEMVEMVQPGNPCIVRLSGHRMCFRGDDVVNVLVHSGAPA